VTFAVLLIVLGGFLLGGSWSIWKADHDTKGRTGPQDARRRGEHRGDQQHDGEGDLRLV
jgi:hypothetical protein